MKLQSVLLLLCNGFVMVSAQQYDDDYGGDYNNQQQGSYYQDDSYGGDTLYQDYAEGREMKTQGGNGGLMKTAAVGITGWFLGGKIHSRRAVKKANEKTKQDMKALYTRYYKDVSALQSEIAELQTFIKESTKQQLKDEFLMADVDGNLLVSRAEFEQHKKRYLRSHPENSHLFPAFEDFDPDSNGLISLAEHEEYYRRRNMI